MFLEKDVIREYILKLGISEISMPLGPVILNAQAKDDNTVLLWAVVDPEETSKSVVRFLATPTYERFDFAEFTYYVSTVLIQGTYFHIFCDKQLVYNSVLPAV